jgi:hypothetical protein
VTDYKQFTLVVIAAICLLPSARVWADPPMADELGRTACSDDLSSSRKIPRARAIESGYVQWVAGALTGGADKTRNRLTSQMSLEEVAVTFTTYCMDHPASTILDSVRAIRAGYRIRPVTGLHD